jgi:PAS domain S-box-containing protein
MAAARDGEGKAKVEDALRASEERVRLLLESTGEGIYGIDPAGRCTFANPACARLLRYDDPAELLGQNMHALIHRSRPDGTPLPLAECRIYQAVSAGRGVQVDDEVFWRKDGSCFPVEYRSSPIARDGERLGAVVTFVDVTGRRRAEEAMRLREGALKAVAQGIFITDPARLDEPISYVNAAFERLTGYRLTEVRGRDVAFLCGPDTDPAAARGLRAAYAEGRQAELELLGYRKDGSTFWAVLSVAPVRDAGGRVTHFIGVLTDITQRKRDEEELRAAKEAAEAANLAKSQFLANMSHELRTPLNAVILYSELLQEEAADRGLDAFVPDLEKIRAAGKHLLALVNGVLDLSKVEAGKMELYLEDFDVGQVVREVIDTVQPLAAKRDNRLELRCPPDAGTMRADLTKLRQVLFNLLSNACKFTEKGLVELEVAREQAEGGDRVVFRVRDTGIGMTAEQLGQLFRPFTQADASTTRKYGGTGLGLAIARRFCELMGGEIAALSAPGKGTTFTVRLPARVAEPKPPEQSVTGREAAGAATILVVDDEAAARDLLAAFLRDEGFRPVTAGGGREGLRLARAERPAAILLDVLMPDMDGWAVPSALKADPAVCDIPVILLTMMNDQNMGYTLGAAEYLHKPVDSERLVAVLRKYRPADAGAPILIVEDDPGTRDVLRRALTRQGWAVAEAAGGRAGLRRAAERRPALVVLDLLMPEMDGFEFLDGLRKTETGRSVPVVVLTAKDLTGEDRARLQGRVEKILQKGALSRQELLGEVRRLVASAAPGPAAKGG